MKRITPPATDHVSDGEAMVQATVAVLGLCQLPISLLREHLTQGALVPAGACAGGRVERPGGGSCGLAATGTSQSSCPPYRRPLVGGGCERGAKLSRPSVFRTGRALLSVVP